MSQGGRSRACRGSWGAGCWCLNTCTRLSCKPSVLQLPRPSWEQAASRDECRLSHVPVKQGVLAKHSRGHAGSLPPMASLPTGAAVNPQLRVPAEQVSQVWSRPQRMLPHGAGGAWPISYRHSSGSTAEASCKAGDPTVSAATVQAPTGAHAGSAWCCCAPEGTAAHRTPACAHRGHIHCVCLALQGQAS